MHHFQLLRTLGRGSGGEAILAEDLRGQKSVLKFVPLEGRGRALSFLTQKLRRLEKEFHRISVDPSAKR